uniref:Uncharacterized protein n=1 Tax=Cucumis melo TaxID=3656 RepID=A0A9I9EFM2_CUCME
MIAHMDLQSTINLLDHLPCPISWVHDFKALAVLKNCGYATVVCMWWQPECDSWLWTWGIAIYCHYLDSFSHFAAE